MFFFNDTATTEIYTLSLHDALPILYPTAVFVVGFAYECFWSPRKTKTSPGASFHFSPETLISISPDSQVRYSRSEEHTSELQSRQYLVCRLLLEKKNIQITNTSYSH